MLGPARPASLSPTRTEGTIIDKPSETPSPSELPPRPRPRAYIDDFGEGRVCAEPSCQIVLSRYNSGRVCWKHEDSARSANTGTS